jgi:hypothetical protein
VGRVCGGDLFCSQEYITLVPIRYKQSTKYKRIKNNNNTQQYTTYTTTQYTQYTINNNINSKLNIIQHQIHNMQTHIQSHYITILFLCTYIHFFILFLFYIAPHCTYFQLCTVGISGFCMRLKQQSHVCEPHIKHDTITIISFIDHGTLHHFEPRSHSESKTK